MVGYAKKTYKILNGLNSACIYQFFLLTLWCKKVGVVPKSIVSMGFKNKKLNYHKLYGNS